MSQENPSTKQPLIRYVNRQQMSWRAVDVERLIEAGGASLCIFKGAAVAFDLAPIIEMVV